MKEIKVTMVEHTECLYTCDAHDCDKTSSHMQMCTTCNSYYCDIHIIHREYHPITDERHSTYICERCLSKAKTVRDKYLEIHNEYLRSKDKLISDWIVDCFNVKPPTIFDIIEPLDELLKRTILKFHEMSNDKRHFETIVSTWIEHKIKRFPADKFYMHTSIPDENNIILFLHEPGMTQGKMICISHGKCYVYVAASI